MRSRIGVRILFLVLAVAIAGLIWHQYRNVELNEQTEAPATPSEKELQIVLAAQSSDDPRERILALESFLNKYPESQHRGRAFRAVFIAYAGDLGDSASALSHVEQALAEGEDEATTASILYLLFDFWIERDLGQAASIGRRALATDLEIDWLYNGIGYNLAERGDSMDLALSLCKRAVALAEDDRSAGYCYDSLGWAYYKMGRLDEAVEALETALAKYDERDPEVLYHLGMAHKDSGNLQKAAEYLFEVLVPAEDAEIRTLLESIYYRVHGSGRDLDEDLWQARWRMAEPAPDFALKDLADKEHKLSTHLGKVVVLYFWHPT